MTSQELAFEVFVGKAIQQVEAEVRGRSAKAKEIRATCARVAEAITAAKQEHTITAPLPTPMASTVMQPIQLGCETEQEKLQELCLGVLHKLVAHAWLQGETANQGNIGDTNVVCHAIRIAVHCSDSVSSKVHLAVIRLLLTVATSDHFVPHGAALVHCVKVIFNLAIATDNQTIALTAQNALLQMINTTVRKGIHSSAPPLNQLLSRGNPPLHRSGSDSLNRSHSRSSTMLYSPRDAGAAHTNRTAQLFALAEQCDFKGLEAAMEPMRRDRSVSELDADVSVAAPSASGSPTIVHALSMRTDMSVPNSGGSGPLQEEGGGKVVMSVAGTSGPGGGTGLDVLEADVVMVLSALCRLAARQPLRNGNDTDVYILAGKQLASELLLKVVESSANAWFHLPASVWAHVRQPFCLVMLRAAMPTDDDAFTRAPRLFSALLVRTPLRYSLKAEMGAFFPLMLLRPLDSLPTRSKLLASCLEACLELAGDAQVMVELFLNYDCDLQAVNVFERWLEGLRRTVVAVEAAGVAPEAAMHTKAAAVNALASAMLALDQWVQALEAGTGGAGSDSASVVEPTPEAAQERFEEIKGMKDQRAAGLLMFESKPLKGIQMLQDCGAVGKDAEAVASWLRKNLHALNRETVGELFGLIDERAQAIMHAYIDLEDFSELHLDDGLRKLLREFKLPGESQQIDRIMEKFAQRYCQCNLGRFKDAEDAYRLAFATIMLNTDVHNPMADHMLTLEMFVEMNSNPDEEGAGVPVLPVKDLEAIYQRVAESEIRMLSRPGSGTSRSEASRRFLQPRRLAAALGLNTLVRSLNNGASGRGSQLNTPSRVKMNKVSSARWHTAAAPQHVRHILQVSSACILEVLRQGVRLATGLPVADKAYTNSLQGLRAFIRMAARFGMHSTTEDAVSMLCTATGTYSPAAPGSALEGRQVDALRAVMQTAVGPEGLMLGASWWPILRAISVLEAMHELAADASRMTKASATASPRAAPLPLPSPRAAYQNEAVFLSTLTQMEASWKAAVTSLSAILQPAAATSDVLPRVHDALFMSPSAEEVAMGAAAGAGAGGDASLSANPYGRLLDSSQLHGAALLAFVGSEEGTAAINTIFERTTDLDGESVVIFVRALCAVSTQELNPLAGAPPRVTLLQRLVEVLHANMGRIRLVWGRIWAAAGPHFVAAACNEDTDVALMAVNALKQLVAQLLQRSELTFFNWQQHALAPFALVLRHSGQVEVRAMAIGCVKVFLQQYTSLLGSGWPRALEAIELAMLDTKFDMVQQGLQTLNLAIAASVRAAAFLALLPLLLALSVVGAVQQAHPHLHLEALNCFQAIVKVLLEQGLGIQATGGASSDAGVELKREASAACPAADAVSHHFTPALQHSPLLAELNAERSSWCMVVRAYANVAVNAAHQEVSDQAIEEVMRMLHHFAPLWEPRTLVATFRCVHETLFGGDLTPAVDQGQVVHLPALRLTRLLAWFQTFLPSLWTLLVTEYDVLGADALRQLLKSLLVLMHVRSMDAVQAGVAALQQMSVVMGGPGEGGGSELDMEGWTAFTDSLTAAAAMDTVTGVPPVQRMETTLLMQRTVAEVLKANGAVMPALLQLRLLEVLQASVRRAAAGVYKGVTVVCTGGALGAIKAAASAQPAPVAPPEIEKLKSFQDRASGSAEPGPPAAVHRNGAHDKPEHAEGTGEGERRANGASADDVDTEAFEHLSGDQHGQLRMLQLMQQNDGVGHLLGACKHTRETLRRAGKENAETCARQADALMAAVCKEIVDSCAKASSTTRRRSVPDDADREYPWTLRDNTQALCCALKALHTDAMGQGPEGAAHATISGLVPSLCTLIECGAPPVREALSEIFIDVVWPALDAKL